MASMSTLTLKNKAAESLAFVPHDNLESQNTAVLRHANADGVPLGDAYVNVGTRRTSSGKYSSTAKFSVPQIVTDDSAGASQSKIVRTAYAEVKMTFDASSTATEREDLAALVSSLLLQNADVAFATSTLVGLEAPRG